MKAVRKRRYRRFTRLDAWEACQLLEPVANRIEVTRLSPRVWNVFVMFHGSNLWIKFGTLLAVRQYLEDPVAPLVLRPRKK